MHAAIIMDGNGRWGEERGLDRGAGHRAGASAVRTVVERAPSLGIQFLTLYAFSSDNWKRPRGEVELLMRLFGHFLDAEAQRCVAEGVRLQVIGSRERLAASLLRKIEAVEEATAEGNTLQLRLAIDYSSRRLLTRAAQLSSTDATPEEFRQTLHRVMHADPATPDVDILIRSGREQRLSDFLLWEAAYAELWFTDVLWPDFGFEELSAAVHAFQARTRRFGGILPIRQEEASCSMSS